MGVAMGIADRLGARLARPKPPPEYRNDSVVGRIQREHDVDEATVRRWFEEALKFLDVCARSRDPLSRSVAVDHAWHAFILHTRDYEAYCRRRFGRLVHHQPLDGADDAAYARAYFAVADRFGKPDPEVWPHPAITRDVLEGWRMEPGGIPGPGALGGPCGGGGGGCGGG